MESDGENIIKTIFGTLMMMGIMLLCVCCLYKYAVCQEKEKKVIYVMSDQNINI